MDTIHPTWEEVYDFTHLRLVGAIRHIERAFVNPAHEAIGFIVVDDDPARSPQTTLGVCGVHTADARSVTHTPFTKCFRDATQTVGEIRIMWDPFMDLAISCGFIPVPLFCGSSALAERLLTSHEGRFGFTPTLTIGPVSSRTILGKYVTRFWVAPSNSSIQSQAPTLATRLLRWLSQVDALSDLPRVPSSSILPFATLPPPTGEQQTTLF